MIFVLWKLLADHFKALERTFFSLSLIPSFRVACWKETKNSVKRSVLCRKNASSWRANNQSEQWENKRQKNLCRSVILSVYLSCNMHVSWFWLQDFSLISRCVIHVNSTEVFPSWIYPTFKYLSKKWRVFINNWKLTERFRILWENSKFYVDLEYMAFVKFKTKVFIQSRNKLKISNILMKM